MLQRQSPESWPREKLSRGCIAAMVAFVIGLIVLFWVSYRHIRASALENQQPQHGHAKP